MRQEINCNYGMITGYKNYPTNEWLALSEFIDNSISSFQEENKDIINGLIIKITFDFSNKENKKIIIEDNANGMNQKELLYAMQPNETSGKKDTEYNQYGVGMKLGIFYFGEDGKVYSKRKNNKEYFIDFQTSKKRDSEGVFVDCLESNEVNINSSSGTKIIISNVYKNRNLIKSDKIKLIKNVLGWRYKKLLNDGMKIILNIKVSDSKSLINGQEEIKPLNIKYFSLNEWIEKKEIKENVFINMKNDINTKINQLQNYYNDLTLSNHFEDKNTNFGKHNFSSYTFDEKKYIIKLKIEAWSKLLKNENLAFSKSFSLNGKEVVLNFGILGIYKGSYSKFSGVSTIHIKRYINHGPNEKGNDNSTINFMDKTEKGYQRRLFGEINLTGIESPDQNKNKFQWTFDENKNMTNEEIIKRELKIIYSSLEEILGKIVEAEQESEINKKTDSPEALKNFSESVGKKVPLINSEVNSNEKCIQINSNEKLKEIFSKEMEEYGDFKFYIYEEDILDELIRINQIDNKENEFKVTYNQNHKIWKPIIRNGDDSLKSEIIYPVIAAIVISNWIYNRNIVLNKEDRKDFYEIFNEVLKN